MPDLGTLIAAASGEEATVLCRPAGGHTRTARGVIGWRGSTAFAKAATTEPTAESLRTEHRVLSALGDHEWVPQILDWFDGPAPVLILEDLSDAHWPPPFPDPDAVWSTLADAAGTTPTIELPEFGIGNLDWGSIAESPELFELVDEAWWRRHRDVLAEASGRVDLRGEALVHADLGFENLCFAQRGVVLVDWEYASFGNPELDVATATADILNSGRWDIEIPLRDPAAWASRVVGWMAQAAPAEPPSWAADGRALRALQAALLRTAVQWAARELDLPSPGGPA